MAATGEPLLIDAAGLHSYYGSSHVLRGVSLRLRRGETLGLMGRNGMGKSTLLKSLMGLVKPRAGIQRNQIGQTVRPAIALVFIREPLDPVRAVG